MLELTILPFALASPPHRRAAVVARYRPPPPEQATSHVDELDDCRSVQPPAMPRAAFGCEHAQQALCRSTIEIARCYMMPD